MKKWFWAVGLLVVGALLGVKGAIVSDLRLVSYMAIGAVLGLGIGTYLDWQAKRKAGAGPSDRT